MPDTAKKLHKESNQDLIDDEVEAIENYDRAIEESDNPEDIATYEHIKGEEEEHIVELEGLDKMKADDITSEQAWEDFKAGYSDFEEKHIGKGRDGDQASMEEKIDILSAKISELNTDMSRLTDSVPQALGTIEEGKTLEEEAEEEQEGEELAGETDEESDLFGGEDDGLDEYFADDGEEDADGEEAVDEEDGEVIDDEEIAESDEEVVDDGEEPVNNEEPSDEEISDEEESAEDSDEDEDYIPIEDIESEDDDMDSDEEETTDEVVEEEDDVEKALAKMVTVLEKMDRRISILERENAGLKKQLSERMTVQTEPRNVAKSRPMPNTNLRLVNGSYNRPPVSTQYVANQRDIGIGKKKESSGDNTSVFRQGLNEVFAECNRIANQTR